MQVFVQIVESGSLTKAANKLNTSLPTVVRTLAALEEHLNIRLINRTTRKITITEEGQRYLQRCRRILYEIEQSELEISAHQKAPSGNLKVTASVMYGSTYIAPLVAKFLKEHPQMTIDLQLSDQNLNLLEEGIDVAVRIGPLDDSNMVAKQVGSVRRMICATPKLLNEIDVITRPKDLSNAPCILFTGLSHGTNWHLHQGEKILSIPVKGPLACNNITSALNVVKEGLGLGMFLSYQVEKELASGELCLLLEQYEPPPLDVNIVYSHAKLMSTRIRYFVDWLTHELRHQMNY
ncbi:LysR family transcriptional regulator [Thalassomonas viridans]|uniref:LysR family transcriptional regulator n=1 Tax=Thalassomonas viridans TaxID=137584 RepID=A0AAF0C9W2_9GAMM|nr:LysR family transcriptional regulator [Thalassomonas viridans]WDE05670.1 LysR family transcriptional regulator [Thalassomonas viridans]